MLRLAIDTHLVTSHHLLPLRVDEPCGLLVELTDGTTDHNASRYRISVFHDLAKVAVNRLAFSQGHELERGNRILPLPVMPRASRRPDALKAVACFVKEMGC